MKKLSFLAWAFIPAVLLFHSCSLFDQDEPIPGFIQINSVTVGGSLGISNSCFDNKIQNVEVFANGETIGIYPLGVSIPVFQTGEVDFEVFCLIPKSGSSQQLEAHVFIPKIIITEFIEAGNTVVLDLNASYSSQTVVHFEEYFEGASNILTTDLDDFDTTFIKNVANDFCVNNSVGEITLFKEQPIMLQSTDELFSFQLPDFGVSYIEFDYLSDLDLVFSFSSTGPSGVLVENVYIVKPKDEWNRIYVNLQEFILQSNGLNYQLVVGASLPILDANGVENQSGTAYIDNLRVISF